MGLRDFFSSDNDIAFDPRLYKRAIVVLLGLVIFMGLAGLTAFFLALRGEEMTLVPNVQGMELSTALVSLQEKELYPRLTLRFSDELHSRGTVLEQDPAPGAMVKAGRRVSLVISRGAVVDRVGNYMGQNLEEVKIHLQTLFSATRQLIVVREPVVYLYSDKPAGTIMEQQPLPETEIDGLTYLDLVVSRGPERSVVEVPNLLGLSLDNALAQIERSGISFRFSVRAAEARETAGSVVSQLPAGGTSQSSLNPVSIVYAMPSLGSGQVGGLFVQNLPNYPYPQRAVLTAQLPNGTRRQLVSVEHPGGQFSVPYVLPEGSLLILEVLNRVVARVEAGQ